MLEFRDVSKSFWTGKQRKVILDRASFRVEVGNSLGILAPNGTGKTTIINMMAGLEKPDEGEIRRSCNISFPLGFMGGVVAKVSAGRSEEGTGGGSAATGTASRSLRCSCCANVRSSLRAIASATSSRTPRLSASSRS